MKRALLAAMGLLAATLMARGDYTTLEIVSHEAMADYVRFESRSWAEGAEGEGGRLLSNTTWEGGEHVILSDLYIPSGVTLTIGEGTVVKFREGTRIKVEDGGRLVLVGAQGNEVVLEGYDGDGAFKGIVLQSSAAEYSDNTYVIANGYSFGKFATIRINDTTAFRGAGQALVPVNVGGLRDSAFSFDWVAETNGTAFASGTMSWGRVSDGTKNIPVPYPEGGLGECESFTVRATTMRCCTPAKGECEVTLSDYLTVDIASHEAMAEFIAFESREWAADLEGEGGRLSANTVWSGTNVIVSDVYIPSGVTLSLSAGTVVEFFQGTRIKIEDGGILNVIGADGQDVIFRGVEGATSFGGIVKMPNGTFTDNSYVETIGFTCEAFAGVALHDSTTFRSSGVALVPVTVSGSRSSAFSIDWVAEADGTAFASGTMKWSALSEGTKNISISYGEELAGCTNFTVRVAVARACHASTGICTVQIRDFETLEIASHEAMGNFIHFESREWAEGLEGEGGRLSTNTTWVGVHKIASDVYIPSGVTLTLEADTVVEFCEGTRIKIEDGGTLRVVGAEGHDVVFRAAEGATNYAGVVKMSNGTYTDNMYVQYLDKPYSAYPNVALHEATTYREAGKMYVAVTLDGTTRDQSFNIDWKTDKGDSGTVTWAGSSDGTKWIQIPVDTGRIGGTTNHVMRITAARGCNIATGTATLTVLEPEYTVEGQVSLAESEGDSGEFAINGDIRLQPIFLNDVETVQYSGKWQEYDAEKAAALLVTIETDNGKSVLKDVQVGATGAFELDLTKYPVGHYTLKHDILDGRGGTLATMEKEFSIVDRDDVELHGGTLTQNETWTDDKVHVVYQTVVVPSIYTLFIEPGTVVKFMTGAGIDISQGGAFFANGIVFTHINDDTVGGDTLSDGFTVAPPMDAYHLTGAFTFGDDTELRGITQNTALTGTITAPKTLSRGSTYRVSGTLTVASGGSLTIPAGTVLKMESEASIVVDSGATLNAIGTRASPIVITSIKDDSFSGDTNGDGDKTLPQPGDWATIKVAGGMAQFEHTSILYGSRNQTTGAINMTGGAVVFDNGEIAHGLYDAVGVESGHFYMTNSVIRDCLLAFRHWANDSIVNCVVYDCGRLTQGGGQTFVNCVFSEIAETWEAFRFPNSTYRNCCFWNEGGSILTAEGMQDALSVCGTNGNVWGNPLFVDPENGDFRILESSPCVDAADSEAAPEFDYFGQPRVTLTDTGTNLVGQLADIGICEVMPRDVTSDIDFVPRSVRTASNAVPGQLLFVKWEIVNAGGREVDAAWRDTVSLVSETGREVVLGDKTTASRVGSGGIVFCSGYFTVPAIPEGAWYPKVNVNSYHDIFEGALAENNALTGDGAVEVAVEAIDPAMARNGVINGGMPTVLKLVFGEGDENRMVKFRVPAGVRVTWGVGFVPGAGGVSGSAESGGTPVQFVVPEEEEAVYVVLESSTTVEYEMATVSGSLAVTDVEPGNVPSSGEISLRLSGAGFMAGAAVKLSGNGATITAESVQVVDSRTIATTLDCGKLAGGAAYDVVVEVDGETVAAKGAVRVAAAPGVGHLTSRLELPDSTRQGRVAVGHVICFNSGNADMDVPVFVVVSKPGDVALRGCESTNQGWTNAIWLVGISPSYPKGKLKPGDEARIPFEFMVTGDYRIELLQLDSESPLVRESVFPTWPEFSAAIASAATALNGTDGRISDYGVLYDYAIKAGYGDNCGVVRGVLTSDSNGAPMAQRTVVAIDSDGVVSGRAVTDAQGAFVFSSLVSTNTYVVTGAGFESSAVGDVIPETALATVVALVGHDFGLVRAAICANGERVAVEDAVGVVPVLYCENGARWPEEPVCEDGVYLFGGMPDGIYTLVAECSGDTYWAGGTAVTVSVACGRATEEEVCVPVEKCGRVRLRLEKDGIPASGVECHADRVDSDDIISGGIDATTDEEGCALFHLRPGAWNLSVSGGYGFVSGEELAVESVLESETEVLGDVTFTPFTAFPDVGPCPLAVSFSADFLPDSEAVASWAWDFDGDGTADSDEAAPSHTYSTPGRKTVTLSVVYTNGTSAVYASPAVDVWDKEFVELESTTLLLDASSGYRIASRTEETLVLEYTGEAVPADLAEVSTMVIPGEEMVPLGVLSWRETEAGIVVETESASPVVAYHSMRVATITALGSRGKPICSYKDRPIGPFTFTTELGWDGKWRKRGTLQTRKGVALEIEWNTGVIHCLQAVEKNEAGKIVFWESRFKGRWEPEVTIGGQFEATGQKNRRGAGVKGNPYKPLSVDDQLLALVAGVPICYSAGAEFTAIASLGGEIAIRPAFDVDIGYRYAPDLGNKGFRTFRRLDDERGLALHGKGEVDFYAGLFFEIYAGANKKAGKKEFGVKVCDINVGGGVAAKASMKVSSDEFEPDVYSFGFYGRFKFDFAPVEVNLGLWKFKPLNFKWHPEKEIFKRSFKTPVPRLSITHEGTTGVGETVAFENQTDYGQWKCPESLLDDGDNQFVKLPKGERYRHVYAALPGDTRKYEVKLKERYAYFVGLLPILDTYKANSYTITVHGRDETIPTNRVEVSGGRVPQSCDPNEMAGPLGAGAARYVAPGEWMTYTVYFENKETATAAAQEVYVTEQLSGALDWSTFEVVDVGFNHQIDLGLGGKRRGASETGMTGTAYKVRTTLDFDEKTGAAKWYMRIVDERTETRWPKDVFAGFLPPNDETGRGEGHITYRVKVREDAAAGTVVRASASIVFDYNEAIETDPAWWNTVAEMGKATVDLGNGVSTNVTVMVGAPWGGQLPDPGKQQGMRFAGWFTGPNGTGTEVTAESLVEKGANLYAFWDASAAPELWLDVSWGAVEIGTNGVVKGYALDGSDVEGSANRYVLTGTSSVHSVRFAGGSFTNTWTNLVIDLGAKDAVGVSLEGASVDVTLAGDNFIASGEDCAGVRVDTNSVLVLQGMGRLEAYGGKCGAGIGGGKLQESGRVKIRSGTIEAYGGEYGAGIGGGLVAPAAGAVIVTGGSVKARGSDGGEDIGSGFGREETGKPTDDVGATVYEVEVPFATDTLPVTVAVDLGGGRTYQYTGMGHEDDTSLWFWLPDGTYEFEADGDDYGAHVAEAKVAAVFTDPGAEHFEAPAAEMVDSSATGWRVGLNPAFRTTPFVLWTATGLDGHDWAWVKLTEGTDYVQDPVTGAVEWTGGQTMGLRVFKFEFLPKK